MADYLVTGGAGFIGSNIVETLLDQGASVRVLDNFSTGTRDNIAPFLDRIELVEGDLRRDGDVRRAVDGVRYILHQGAIPSVPRSVDDPVTTNEANVTGTLNLLVAARDARVARLVFASSSSVYGDTPQLPKHEGMPLNPLSPYAASKLIGEHYCRLFHQLYGLETVTLRYFNVFGPRQDPASTYAAVVPKFIDALTRRTPPDVHGDGLQTRDFTFVADVVRANLLACEAPTEAAGQVFNVACHQQITVLDLFKTIRDLVGAGGVEPHHTPPRPGDVRHSFADISRAAELLGYRPTWSLRDALTKTVEAFGRAR
jgi:nucleoside-diphosphate-sugar epimerase